MHFRVKIRQDSDRLLIFFFRDSLLDGGYRVHTWLELMVQQISYLRISQFNSPPLFQQPPVQQVSPLRHIGRDRGRDLRRRGRPRGLQPQEPDLHSGRAARQGPPRDLARSLLARAQEGDGQEVGQERGGGAAARDGTEGILKELKNRFKSFYKYIHFLLKKYFLFYLLLKKYFQRYVTKVENVKK